MRVGGGVVVMVFRGLWDAPLRVMTSAWWMMRSIMAEATAWSSETSPQREEGGLVVGVGLLQGLDRGEARGAEALFRAGGLPGGDFGLEDGSGVLRAGPGPGDAALGRGSGGVADPGCFHDPGEVVDAGGRLVSGGGHQAACSSKSLPVRPRA